MSDVQSIETAPKDGREILVWDGSRWSIALFDVGYPGDKGRWVDDLGGSWSYDNELTHWAPLPPAPLPEESSK